MSGDDLERAIDELRSFATDHQHVEAKRARDEVPKRLWETLSAFANTPGGGLIILGLDEENGSPRRASRTRARSRATSRRCARTCSRASTCGSKR